MLNYRGTVTMHRGALAAATILSMGVNAAVGQTPSQNQRELDPRGLAALHEFTRCVVARDPRGAERVLAVDYESEAYQSAIRRLTGSHEGCLARGSRLGSTGLPFVGGLAEALVVRAPGLAKLPAATKADPAHVAYQPRNAGEGLGACVVEQAPGGSAALFATLPGTAEEIDAFKAIGATIQQCVPVGMTIKLNKLSLRAFLALGAYRIARAGAGLASSEGGR